MIYIGKWIKDMWENKCNWIFWLNNGTNRTIVTEKKIINMKSKNKQNNVDIKLTGGNMKFYLNFL